MTVTVVYTDAHCYISITITVISRLHKHFLNTVRKKLSGNKAHFAWKTSNSPFTRKQPWLKQHRAVNTEYTLCCLTSLEGARASRHGCK